MPGERRHQYRISNHWTGNRGTGTSTYRAYSRDHELNGAGKAAVIPGSSDPLFRGDPTRYNPEELLVGAISACHMLWVLHLCADAGIVVTEYRDEALGEMVEHADGSGEFTRVVLRPKMTIQDGDRVEDAIAVHDRAHDLCALARSMNFLVEHEPVVTVSN
ncbi:MAG TPA: OsmC family protein [Bryobacteraceae bacterium]|nr:OsmC family protein [Bryobacteraceae bacterium]